MVYTRCIIHNLTLFWWVMRGPVETLALCTLTLLVACHETRVVSKGQAPAQQLAVAAQPAAPAPRPGHASTIPVGPTPAPSAPPTHLPRTNARLARALLDYMKSPTAAKLEPLDQYASRPRLPEELKDHIHIQAMVLVAASRILRGQKPGYVSTEQMVVTSYLLPRGGDRSRLRILLNVVLNLPRSPKGAETVYRQISDGHFSMHSNLDKLIGHSKLAQLRPGMMIGDIACGVGSQAAVLARAVGPTGRVYAVDIDDGVISFLQHLKKRIPGGERIIPVKSRIDDVTLPKGSLDLALIHGIGFLIRENQSDAPLHAYTLITSIHRALKPNGQLLIRSHLKPAVLSSTVTRCGFRLEGQFNLRRFSRAGPKGSDHLVSFRRENVVPRPIP